MKRRTFLKTSGLMGAAAMATGVTGSLDAARNKPKAVPTIKLGTLEVSRLVLGSNPFWGYSHQSGDRDKEMRQYHTDEVIAKVLDEAAANGITAMASPPDKRWVELYARYLAGGGKLKIWIAQCHGPPEKMEQEIDYAINGGAKAVFIQGARAEQQVGRKNFDTLRRWVQRIKDAGLPAGTGAHWPEVPGELEKRKFPTDFYFQCFYNVSRIGQWGSAERETAVAAIRKIDKPVVAYKILGAGRLPAQAAFEYAFAKLRRKDGVCVGIHRGDAVDHIRQNALYTELLT